MEKQDDIFDPPDPPVSHTGDPQSSKKGEARLNNSGRRAVRQLEVLRLLNEHPQHTAGEYARIFVAKHRNRPLQATASTPGKRITDLLNKGWIERLHERHCQDSGEDAWTYAITERGYEVLTINKEAQ